MFSDIPGVEFRMFCSFPNESGGNCSNPAVGDMPIVLDNNPKDGADVMYLPICQEHLDKHDIV